MKKNIVLSRTVSTVAADLKAAGIKGAVGMPVTPRAGTECLFRSVASPPIGYETITLGKSLEGYPETLRSVFPEVLRPDTQNPLAKWIRSTADLTDTDRGEIGYFIASGGHRVQAIVKALRVTPTRIPYEKLADYGAGMGAISTLIAMEKDLGVKKTVQIEPKARYHEWGRDFHKALTPGFEREVKPASATEYVEPYTNIAMYCHFLFRLGDGWRKVLEDGWNSLRFSSVMVINEGLREANPHMEVDLLHHADMADFLKGKDAKVFLPEDDWRIPHPFANVAADKFQNDTLILARKV